MPSTFDSRLERHYSFTDLTAPRIKIRSAARPNVPASKYQNPAHDCLNEDLSLAIRERTALRALSLSPATPAVGSITS